MLQLINNGNVLHIRGDRDDINEKTKIN